MNALQQSIEGETASLRDCDFPVQDESLRLQAGQSGDYFGEVAPERLQRFRLQCNARAFSKCYATKSVPLWLILPFGPLGDDLHRERFHRRQGRVDLKRHC